MQYVSCNSCWFLLFFFFQAEDGIRDVAVTGVQTCALPILARGGALEPAERRVGCVGHGAILLASNLDRAHLDDQPVVRGRDARRQLGRELGVGRRVREMREEGAPRANALGRLHRLRDREVRSEEHTSELQSRLHLVCRLLLEKKKKYEVSCD